MQEIPSYESESDGGTSAQKTQYAVVGIVSAGIGIIDFCKLKMRILIFIFSGCALPKLPGIYTRVESYLDWIQEHLLASNSGTGLRQPPPLETRSEGSDAPQPSSAAFGTSSSSSSSSYEYEDQAAGWQR